MLSEFNEMERCFAYSADNEAAWEEYIIYAAAHESFFVRYSAAAAIEIYGSGKHIPVLLNILEREECEPVYGQPAGLKNTDAAAGDPHVDDIIFPEKTTSREKAAWQRRGKLKQAACLAVRAVYKRERPEKKNERLSELLHRYAADQKEDYSVRAAAVRALGAMGLKDSIPVLRTAETDPEFCTSLESKKAIKDIESGIPADDEVFAPFAENSSVNENPFYIDDIAELRNKVLGSKNETVKRIWRRIDSGVRNGGYPWFEPFGALVTQDENFTERARSTIEEYASSLENLRYNPGVHFHSWCFAFPHARMCLYFQWLYTMNAFSDEEAQELAAKFISHQFLYHHSCYRVKPYPETVDNQTLSLAISDALIGYLFGNKPFNSRIARLMFEMSIRRVEFVLEEMGKEGYSGEGSTYMNHVIASCIPLGTELTERIYKRNCFDKCRNAAEMTAREIMPDGFSLPWDHYGYILPTLQCLAYNSRRIDPAKYSKLIEKHTDYANSVITGWGFDDLVWTLIWYTEADNDNAKEFESWFMPKTAGCLISEDTKLALVQMFDDGERERISRYHCNPNSLILSAYGAPLLTEGCPAEGCGRFKFKETSKTFDHMSIEAITVNDGYGCAGAHSVIIVDGYEAMRPKNGSDQLRCASYDSESNSIYADVTPVYKQNFSDTELAARRSRLMYDKFWLIEDTVSFGKAHSCAMRLIARPELISDGDALYIKTVEGVELNIIELEGGGKISSENIDGYPNTLEQRSVIIDNVKYGKSIKWRHVLFPRDCKKLIEDISMGWNVIADSGAALSFKEAYGRLLSSTVRAPITAPVWFFEKMSKAKKLWYMKKIKNPGGGYLLRLPRDLNKACVWLNGQAYHAEENGLLDTYIRAEASGEEYIEIVLSTEVGTSQYKDEYNGGGFFGTAAVYKELPHEDIKVIKTGSGTVICAGDKRYFID